MSQVIINKKGKKSPSLTSGKMEFNSKGLRCTLYYKMYHPHRRQNCYSTPLKTQLASTQR